MFEGFFVRGVVLSAYLDEPKIFRNGDGKYFIRLCVDKNDARSISELDKYYQVAMTKGTEIWMNRGYNSGIASPFKEGVQYGTAYANYRILDLNTREKPQVIDQNKKLLSTSVVQPGAVVYVAMSFFPYNVNGKCGISAKLHSLMFIKQGEPIRETSDAVADFADFKFDE